MASLAYVFFYAIFAGQLVDTAFVKFVSFLVCVVAGVVD